MATESRKSTNSPAAQTKSKDEEKAQATEGGSAEVQVAEALGVPEGEVKALRADAGLDQLAGHEANVHAWEASEAGQAFLKNEKERAKAQKDEDKRTAEQTNDDDLDEGAAKYQEALAKARKSNK